MLTIEEYRKKYPNEKCWGSFAEDYKQYQGPRVILEGLLQFDETACCWGGPFEGNYAQFCLKDYTEAIHPLSRRKGHTPKKWLDVLADAEKERKAKAERSIFPEKQNFREYPEDPSWEFPIKITMYGNDDTSYSKCYKSEQEALEELNLFIGNQPLNFHQVIDFGFIFTN
jgi:hypothetical protein